MLFRRLPVPAIALLLLAGCIDVPALDAAVSDRAFEGPAPRIVSTTSLIEAAPEVRLPQEEAQALSERAEALQKRAVTARDPVDRGALQSRADALQSRADALRRAE